MIALFLVYGVSVVMAAFLFAGLLEWFRYLSTQNERDQLSWHERATYYFLGFLLGPAVDALLNKKDIELRVFISVILAFATLLTIFFMGKAWQSAAIFLTSMLINWLSLPINKSTK